MKKVVLIVILALGMLLVACDKQKALDSILDDPQMKSHILQQILTDEISRAEMADSVLADTLITNVYLNGLAENEVSRGELLERILVVDSTGEWITAWLAEDPDLKRQMRKASRR
ncbi:MAG: hypothetical protein V3S06_05790 [candidate division Zixibacteria bacterium]